MIVRTARAGCDGRPCDVAGPSWSPHRAPGRKCPRPESPYSAPQQPPPPAAWPQQPQPPYPRPRSRTYPPLAGQQQVPAAASYPRRSRSRYPAVRQQPYPPPQPYPPAAAAYQRLRLPQPPAVPAPYRSPYPPPVAQPPTRATNRVSAAPARWSTSTASASRTASGTGIWIDSLAKVDDPGHRLHRAPRARRRGAHRRLRLGLERRVRSRRPVVDRDGPAPRRASRGWPSAGCSGSSPATAGPNTWSFPTWTTVTFLTATAGGIGGYAFGEWLQPDPRSLGLHRERRRLGLDRRRPLRRRRRRAATGRTAPRSWGFVGYNAGIAGDGRRSSTVYVPVVARRSNTCGSATCSGTLATTPVYLFYIGSSADPRHGLIANAARRPGGPRPRRRPHGQLMTVDAAADAALPVALAHAARRRQRRRVGASREPAGAPARRRFGQVGYDAAAAALRGSSGGSPAVAAATAGVYSFPWPSRLATAGHRSALACSPRQRARPTGRVTFGAALAATSAGATARRGRGRIRRRRRCWRVSGARAGQSAAAAAGDEGPDRRHGRKKRDNCDVLHDRFLLDEGPERRRDASAYASAATCSRQLRDDLRYRL